MDETQDTVRQPRTVNLITTINSHIDLNTTVPCQYTEKLDLHMLKSMEMDSPYVKTPTIFTLSLINEEVQLKVSCTILYLSASHNQKQTWVNKCIKFNISRGYETGNILGQMHLKL